MDKYNKLRIEWDCRRGMLELDKIIMPFYKAHFDQLTDDNAGTKIVKNALKVPLLHILENAGLNSQALLATVENAKPGQGINVMEPEKGLQDLKKAGVIDPARVTREAVQNAISIAATAITMGALIVEIPEKENTNAANAGMGGMY